MPPIDFDKFARHGGPNTPVVGAALASSATITPTHGIHLVSGTEQITTIVPPYTGFQGPITLIASGAWTLATGGTAGSAVGTVVTMVASQAIDLVFMSGVWYPKIAD